MKSWRQKMEVLEDQAVMHDTRMKQLAFALIAGVVFYFAQGAPNVPALQLHLLDP